MTSAPERVRPSLNHLQIQQCKYDLSSHHPLSRQASLSPGLQSNSPPALIQATNQPVVSLPLRIGSHLLLESLDSKVCPGIPLFRAVNLDSQEESLCKAIPISRYSDILLPYSVASPHKNIVGIENVVVGATHAYVFFSPNYGDLHAYLRSKIKLTEREACRLFHQLVMGVKHCHERGIVLHDIKLRKCVFANKQKTEIQLSGLEDSVVLSDPADDRMTDRHGCPAYVSPEIIRCTAMFSDKPADAGGSYSGRAADIWSLGIILFVMLTGRYPFMDVEPMALFARIALGYCAVPASFSEPVQNLIYGMLRRSAEERLTAADILDHPWFSLIDSSETGSADDEDSLSSSASGGQIVASDQCVPELVEGFGDIWCDM